MVQEKEVKECHLEMLSFSQKEHKTDHMLRLNSRGEVSTSSRGLFDNEYKSCKTTSGLFFLNSIHTYLNNGPSQVIL